MPSSVNIGDSPTPAVQPVVSSLCLPTTTQAAIEDIANPVNLALYSGKKVGAMYVLLLTGGGTDIIVARGSDPDDEWHRISDAGAAPIIPA